MASECKKDFNKMLNDNMKPKFVTLDDEGAKTWGGKTMVVATKLDYDNLIKKIPIGYVVTTNELRNKLASIYHTDIACPLTAGIFVNISAWASFQRKESITPFWRMLKAKGELNKKFPKYPKLQKSMLEKEGFKIIKKGIHYYVKDYDKYLYKFNLKN